MEQSWSKGHGAWMQEHRPWHGVWSAGALDAGRVFMDDVRGGPNLSPDYILQYGTCILLYYPVLWKVSGKVYQPCNSKQTVI